MSTRPADFSAAQAAPPLTSFRSVSPLARRLTNDVALFFIANVDPNDVVPFGVAAGYCAVQGDGRQYVAEVSS